MERNAPPHASIGKPHPSIGKYLLGLVIYVLALSATIFVMVVFVSAEILPSEVNRRGHLSKMVT